MKKLISAVTSLCMAATMVSSIAPIGAGAADATKGFSIKTFGGASSTISAEDIAAGDVTVPCAMYLTEGTADTTSYMFMFGVQPDSADPAAPSIYAYQATENYYDAAQSFTTADGTEFSTQYGVFFAGSVNARGVYKAAGSQNVITAAESQPTVGIDYACVGGAWTGPVSGGYSWMGANSDDYPIVYFDVTFPKGSAAGDYMIDFYHYSTDANTLVPSNQINVDTLKYAAMEDYSNLNLEGLTITIEGDVEPGSTTTTAATTTTSSATTTTTSSKPDTDADVTIDLGTWELTPEEAAAGKTIMAGATIDAGTNAIAGIDLQFDISGLTDKDIEFEVYDYSPAFNDASLTVNPDVLKLNGATISGSDPIVPDSSKNFLEYDIVVPAGFTGEATFTLTYNKMIKDTSTGELWTSVVIDGVVKVAGDQPAETTTTTTKASETTTTTTTTATTPAPGTPLYGDSNCDKVVNIADVVVLNKWLNDAKSYNLTDQGKLNANCDLTNDELNADDSDAIIRSIVHLVTLPIEG